MESYIKTENKEHRRRTRNLVDDHIKLMANSRTFKQLSPTPDIFPFGPPRSPVRILGSGLSALTLALSLYMKYIPFKIYTKDRRPKKASNQHDYSILLPGDTIEDLRKLLQITREEFRSQLMVPTTTPFTSSPTFAARVHRGRLERLLRLEFEEKIEWECEIKAGPVGSPSLIFPSHIKETSRQGDLTFDCMGVHSPIECGGYKAIEPYVVFRGTVSLGKSLWDQKFRDWFQGNTARIQQRLGQVVLELLINDIDSKNGDVWVTYIYSRPYLETYIGPPDELWAPTRSRDEASSPILVGRFLNEIGRLRLKHKLPEPYDEIFDPRKMIEDKILHWVMRTNLADQPKLINLWNSDEKIYKLGDAVHGMPIIESTGAALAIQDGVEVANQIELNGGANLHHFLVSRWELKCSHVEACRNRLYNRYSKAEWKFA